MIFPMCPDFKDTLYTFISTGVSTDVLLCEGLIERELRLSWPDGRPRPAHGGEAVVK